MTVTRSVASGEEHCTADEVVAVLPYVFDAQDLAHLAERGSDVLVRALDVGRALETLPRAFREALQLRYGLDLPWPEVGRRLGCTTDTARMRATRSIPDLIACLG